MKLVGLIGPGRLGRTLVTLLPGDSYRLGPVLSSGLVSARRAVREMSRGEPIDSPEGLERCEVILAALPEECFSERFEGMAAANFDWAGKVVLHTCARSDRAVCDRLKDRGAAIGGVYPLQVFQRPARDLAGVYFAVGGDLHAVRTARGMVRSWGGEVVRVTREQREQASVAASIASDVLTGVMDLALNRMIAGGFSRKRGLDALRQLIATTVEDYVRSGRKSRPAALLQQKPPRIESALEALRQTDRREAELYRTALRLTLDILEKDAKEFGFLDDSDSARGAGAGG